MASIPAIADPAVSSATGFVTVSPSRGSRLSATTALAWAAGVALVMSTQYLVQPFVWSYWSVADVLLGWGEVLRDRLLVAGCIALGLVGADRLGGGTLPRRAAFLGVAVLVGAIAGEALRMAFGADGERVDPWSVAARVAQWTVVGACAAIVYGIWVRHRGVAAAARASELATSRDRSLLVETQLQSLRHQLDPHFLFNTLATIRRLHSADRDEGGRLLRHLNAYLRSTMPRADHLTTLGEEIDLVASYLAIVRIRMTGRLAVEIDVPHDLRDAPCPPLTLATLVENAVKHGITPTADGGTIRVAARREGGILSLVVTDTGVGIAPAAPASVGGSGIGLANVRARLRALHGSRASLTLAGHAPRGVRAEVRMPASIGGGR